MKYYNLDQQLESEEEYNQRKEREEIDADLAYDIGFDKAKHPLDYV